MEKREWECGWGMNEKNYNVKQRVLLYIWPSSLWQLTLLQITVINSEHNTKNKYLKAMESEQNQANFGSEIKLGRRSYQEASFLFLKFCLRAFIEKHWVAKMHRNPISKSGVNNLGSKSAATTVFGKRVKSQNRESQRRPSSQILSMNSAQISIDTWSTLMWVIWSLSWTKLHTCHKNINTILRNKTIHSVCT